eukprot:Lithocolla_globosa_v1_NODE_5397_length_1246_cov_6.898405.p1 type:complete len:390 gc:universal NODE_5397_length_1246_cov_6.898405:1199-30(-)
MADIFFSYCWADHEQPDPVSPRVVAHAFKQHGYSTWLDIDKLGQNALFQDIASGLAGCRVCIAFVSSRYAKSDNCQMEFTYAAKTLKLPLIPVVLGKDKQYLRTAVGLIMANFLYVDFSDQSRYEANMNSLIQRVDTMLKEGKEELDSVRSDPSLTLVEEDDGDFMGSPDSTDEDETDPDDIMTSSIQSRGPGGVESTNNSTIHFGSSEVLLCHKKKKQALRPVLERSTPGGPKYSYAKFTSSVATHVRFRLRQSHLASFHQPTTQDTNHIVVVARGEKNTETALRYGDIVHVITLHEGVPYTLRTSARSRYLWWKPHVACDQGSHQVNKSDFAVSHNSFEYGELVRNNETLRLRSCFYPQYAICVQKRYLMLAVDSKESVSLQVIMKH